MKRVLFIVFLILLTVNAAYAQESPPPIPPDTASGGEGKREGVKTTEGDTSTEGDKTPAESQVEITEEKAQGQAPVTTTEQQLSLFTIEITPKFQAINLDQESSKAREYRALPEGLYIENFLFYYGSQSQEFGGEIVRVSPLTALVEDGYGDLNYRRYGLLDIDVSLGRFPHAYATPPPFDISAQRDTYNLVLKFTPGDRIALSTNISVEDRKGRRPLTVESFTGITSDSTAIIEILEPADYTTTTIDLGVEYMDDYIDIQLKNSLQIFSNNAGDDLVRNNPNIDGATLKVKTADDYLVHTLAFMPSIRLTDNTRLISTLSYSKITNSIDLIPFTTVSGVGEAFLQDVVDTDVRSLNLSSILSARPVSDVRLNIKYRYNSYKNGTPEIEEPPPYVMIDGGDDAIRYPRIPRYMTYSTRSIGLDGTWSLTDRLSLDTGIENDDTSRGEREVDKENKKRFFLSLHSIILDNLSGRFGYTYTRRRGDYDSTYYKAIYDPDPANDITQHPLMRAFDLSGLDSNTITASLDYSPIVALSLGTTLSLGLSEHPDVGIGRRDSHGESASLYAQYMLLTDLLIHSEYFYDHREIEGSYTWTYDSNLAYPQDPIYSDFTSPVTGAIEDTANVFVIGFNYDVDKWLSITGMYSRYDSTGKGINLPKVSSMTDIYELNASFNPYRRLLASGYPLFNLKDVRINTGYYMERYRRDDFALDNFPVDGPGTDIFLGVREPDYRLSIFSIALGLYF